MPLLLLGGALAALSLASCHCLWRHSWLLDVGFQLSAAATGGLILSAGPREARLQCWLPRWAAAAMAVPLAASL